MSDKKTQDKMYVSAAEPMETRFNGLEENFLLEAHPKYPEKYEDDVKALERRLGRKIGTAGKEELEYRKQPWNMDYYTR